MAFGNGNLNSVSVSIYMTTRNIKLHNLQIIRAFAALNVVLFHSIGTTKDYGYSPVFLDFLAGWGASGVDLFFVLSGFIMVYSQWGTGATPKKFLLGRFYRIVPIYWIVTLFFIVLLVFVPSVFREATLDIPRALASFLFVSQPILGGFPYVAVGWTLEYEVLFYILFACALIVKNRTVSFLILIISLLTAVYIFDVDLIAIEFLWGAIIGLFYRGFNVSNTLSCIMFLTGVSLFLSTIFLHYPFHRYIVWGVPAGLIVLGAAGIPQLHWRVGIFLGDASYSVYLIHFLVIPAFFKVVSLLNLGLIYADILVAFCFMGSTLCGLVFYWIVERPLLMKRHKRSHTEVP